MNNELAVKLLEMIVRNWDMGGSEHEMQSLVSIAKISLKHGVQEPAETSVKKEPMRVHLYHQYDSTATSVSITNIPGVTISATVLKEIGLCIEENRRVDGIKLVRANCVPSLKDAKDIYEALAAM